MYPFFEKIQELLEAKNQTVEWLGDAIGRSRRWVYSNKKFEAVSLDEILKISKVLGFDFLQDYSSWVGAHGGQQISVVSEPETIYKKEKQISVELKIRGSYKAIGLHFGEMLDVIKKEADKRGFEIE